MTKEPTGTWVRGLGGRGGRRFVRWLVLPLFGAGLGIGWWIASVEAEGIPPYEPLHYAGVLEEGGVPVNGSRDIDVSLWRDATSADVSRRACTTHAPSSVVTQGRFRVDLSDECTRAVRLTAELWVEVSVDGTAFAREKLGAVPYAVEADNGVPPGVIEAFAGPAANIPLGWELCDGRAVSSATYPRLFRAIGTTWGDGTTGPGADGTTDFNLPDLQGRFVLGAGGGAGLSERTLGQAGGEEAHTLTTGEMPGHAHAYTDPNAGASPWCGLSWDTTGSACEYPITNGSSTTSAGGGGAHNTVPPFAVSNYVIKY